MAVTYTVEAIDISNADVTLNPTEYLYSGNANKPEVTVTLEIDSETLTLVQDTDFTVEYKNDIDASTAENPAAAEITGIGYYTGTVIKYFNIIAPKPSTISETATSATTSATPETSFTSITKATTETATTSTTPIATTTNQKTVVSYIVASGFFLKYNDMIVSFFNVRFMP